MQLQKTKARQVDEEGNELVLTSDGIIMKLNEELSSKVLNNEFYKAMVTQMQYDNPELKIELSDGCCLESQLMELDLGKVDELSKLLVYENPELRLNEAVKEDKKVEYTMIDELKKDDNEFYGNKPLNRTFKTYKAFFPDLVITPYARTSHANYTSLGAPPYRGGGGGGFNYFNHCGSP